MLHVHVHRNNKMYNYNTQFYVIKATNIYVHMYTVILSD